MPRTIRTIAAALAALVIAAPPAFAMPIDGPVHTSSLAGTTSAPKQDLRSPDARDAAERPQAPADVTVTRVQDLRHLTAGNSIRSDDPVTAALAQERYYSSYGPAPVTAPSTAPAADTSDGIDSLPFVLGLAGALIVGIAAGTGMHLLVIRRRQATGLPA